MCSSNLGRLNLFFRRMSRLFSLVRWTRLSRADAMPGSWLCQRCQSSTSKAVQFAQPGATAPPQEANTRPDRYFRNRRDFVEGDTYTPVTMTNNNSTSTPQRSRKRRESRGKPDFLEVLNIDPLKEYKNPHLLAEFMTDMGYIKPRSLTGLSILNQRKVSRAIRRAQNMGLLPIGHKLVEVK
ncbi:ribosomal protein S18 [Gonapodya prolifera JEL478]|uniref:Small ribosomal subunit protein bS18m n=1 Tax=Gonapodya prolifera (strain JEL478) TaxID=1344416 RepID=A0A139A2I9_GONPJ|nr:ribosomal protein S18 [Gonapodya prolifera JEL478]|eukprot:KXS10997.1 ribosomal protein S18 [Gonapodya prolifera JEL478]